MAASCCFVHLWISFMSLSSVRSKDARIRFFSARRSSSSSARALSQFPFFQQTPCRGLLFLVGQGALFGGLFLELGGQSIEANRFGFDLLNAISNLGKAPMDKKLCPIGRAKYERQSRTAAGHAQTVVYIAAVMVRLLCDPLFIGYDFVFYRYFIFCQLYSMIRHISH